MRDALLWGVALAGLGAIIGSFLAAVTIRWPAGRSVMTGRSACDACGVTIGARDLVPIASGLLLGGKCRACGAAIDPVHWRMEATAALLGGVAGLVVGGPVALAGAAFGWLLLVLAVLDYRHFWLPDRLTLALALAGIVGWAWGAPPPLADRVIGGIAGYGVLAAIALGYRRWRGREGMGAGDPKLLGAIGLWLGWAMLPGVLLLASLVGLGMAALARVGGKAVTRDTALPLGTCMAVAAYPAWLAMIAWPR